MEFTKITGKTIDLRDKVFGKLTVIDYIGHRRWYCKCECGNFVDRHFQDLYDGFTTHCGCLPSPALIDMTGKVCNKLTVIELSDKPNSNKPGAFWLCKCECGNEKIIYGNDLRSGKIKTCGCFIYNKKKPFESRYNCLSKGSKNRGLEFTLTYEDYLEFTKIPNCSYCDRKIIWEPYTTKIKGKAYYRSNLDRKDNSFGYTKENCVVCCWPCNEMKGNRLSHYEMLLLKPTLIEIRKVREANSINFISGTLNKNSY